MAVTFVFAATASSSSVPSCKLELLSVCELELLSVCEQLLSVCELELSFVGGCECSQAPFPRTGPCSQTQELCRLFTAGEVSTL